MAATRITTLIITLMVFTTHTETSFQQYETNNTDERAATHTEPSFQQYETNNTDERAATHTETSFQQYDTNNTDERAASKIIYVNRDSGNDSKTCGNFLNPCRSFWKAMGMSPNIIYMAPSNESYLVDKHFKIRSSLTIIGLSGFVNITCSLGLYNRLFIINSPHDVVFTLQNITFNKCNLLLVNKYNSLTINMHSVHHVHCAPQYALEVAGSEGGEVNINITDSLFNCAGYVNIPSEPNGALYVEGSYGGVVNINISGSRFNDMVQVMYLRYGKVHNMKVVVTMGNVIMTKLKMGAIYLINKRFASANTELTLNHVVMMNVGWNAINVYNDNGAHDNIQVMRLINVTISDVGKKAIHVWDGYICRKNTYRMTITNSTFQNCRQSAIRIQPDGQNAKVDMKLQNVTFNDNSDPQYGGALYIGTTQGIHNSVKTSIENSQFLRNSAEIGGGGVAFVDTYNNMKITMMGCYFEKNIGGSVYSENVNLVAIRTKFIDNFSQRGGSLFVRGKEKTLLKECIFQTNMSGGMLDLTTEIEIIESNFTYKYGQHINTFTAFLYSGEFLSVNTAQFDLACPDNHVMTKTKIYRTYMNGANIYVTDTTKILYLDIKCAPCNNGQYTIAKSSYALKHSKEKLYKGMCQKCPSGGSCNSGRIKSLPLFWGYIRNSTNISFAPCPSGYCTLQPRSYNSCKANRTGRLCSKCIENHSLDIFSTACIANEKCDKNISYTIIASVMIIACIVTAVLMHLEEIKQFIASSWASMKNTCISCFKNSSPLISCCSRQNKSNEDGKKSSMFSKIKILIVFFQVQPFMKVPSNENFKLIRQLQNILSSISSLHFGSDHSIFSGIEVCHDEQFSSVHKKYFTLFAWIFPVLLSLFIYAGARLFKYNSIKLKAQVCTTRLITLSFIPVTTRLLELVHCSTIYEDDGEIKFLFSQADILCPQWWQNIVYVVVGIWIVPMILSIFVAAKVLEDKDLDNVLLILLFPPSAIYFILQRFQLYQKLTKKERPNTSHRSKKQFDNSILISVQEHSTQQINDEVSRNINTASVTSCDSHTTLLDKHTTLSYEPTSSELIIEIDQHPKESTQIISINDKESIERVEIGTSPCIDKQSTQQVNDEVNENIDNVFVTSAEPLITLNEPSSSELIIETDQYPKQKHEITVDEDYENTLNTIRDIILGPIKVHYWPGIIQLKKVLLTATFVTCDYIVLRLYGLILILGVYLVFLLYKKPYKDRVILWFDVCTTISLIMLGNLSLFDTQKISHTPDTDDSRNLYKTFQILKFIVITIQPFVFTGLLLIDKCFPEKKQIVVEKKLN